MTPALVLGNTAQCDCGFPVFENIFFNVILIFLLLLSCISVNYE